MSKSKFRVLYTYLLIALVLLIGVANYFNFEGRMESDAFRVGVSEKAEAFDGAIPSVGELGIYEIATDFSSSTKSISTSRSNKAATTSRVKTKTGTKSRTYTVNAKLASSTVVTARASSGASSKFNFVAQRVSHPSVDAGWGIKVYRNMLYAHSTRAGVSFKQLGVGSTFRATVDGKTATYRVTSRRIYRRDELNADAGLRLAIYNYRGLSLMTCGNGSNDSEAYRLVLFAKKI